MYTGVNTKIMSILKKKAQAKKNTKVITARIQEDLYDSFKKHCEENGFSINEAIKVLIENELKSIQTVYKNEEPFEELSEEENEDFGAVMDEDGNYYIPYDEPEEQHIVIRPEERLRTIGKDDLDPEDALQARILKMYEEYGD
jgi:antitoxin component of RelBE/YafQ-DinJ toxin-antitoxin module